ALHLGTKTSGASYYVALTKVWLKGLLGHVTVVDFTLDATRARVLDLSDRVLSELRAVADRVGTEVRGLDFDRLSPERIEQRRSAWKREIEATAEESVRILNQVKAQLDMVNWTVVDGHRVGMAAVQAAAEEELLALRKEADESLELSQLGMAIEIINHEFTNTIQLTLRYIDSGLVL
ncbi:MAG: DUF3034 family protein, partial [Actinobacteria bacterium]|nr:DUF3034 family protein [Actinomycetota bacterium]